VWSISVSSLSADGANATRQAKDSLRFVKWNGGLAFGNDRHRVSDVFLIL
jgi:hypothetical protein